MGTEFCCTVLQVNTSVDSLMDFCKVQAFINQNVLGRLQLFFLRFRTAQQLGFPKFVVLSSVPVCVKFGLVLISLQVFIINQCTKPSCCLCELLNFLANASAKFCIPVVVLRFICLLVNATLHGMIFLLLGRMGRCLLSLSIWRLKHPNRKGPCEAMKSAKCSDHSLLIHVNQWSWVGTSCGAVFALSDSCVVGTNYQQAGIDSVIEPCGPESNHTCNARGKTGSWKPETCWFQKTVAWTWTDSVSIEQCG